MEYSDPNGISPTKTTLKYLGNTVEKQEERLKPKGVVVNKETQHDGGTYKLTETVAA